MHSIGQQVNLVEEEDYPTAAAASMEDQELIAAMGRIVASEIELMESMEQQEQIGFDHTVAYFPEDKTNVSSASQVNYEICVGTGPHEGTVSFCVSAGCYLCESCSFGRPNDPQQYELGGLEEACKRLGRGLEYLVGVVLGAQIS